MTLATQVTGPCWDHTAAEIAAISYCNPDAADPFVWHQFTWQGCLAGIAAGGLHDVALGAIGVHDVAQLGGEGHGVPVHLLQ